MTVRTGPGPSIGVVDYGMGNRRSVEKAFEHVGARAVVSADRDVLAATDQLIDGYRIDDETWQRLATQLDERQLVEAVFVVGTYTCLAMAFNTFGLGHDDR